MQGNKIPLLGELAGALLECQSNPPHRILVVDDDQDIRRLSAEVLARSGYQADAAEDGAVAWESLQQDYYDLLITDNRMPKVTGVELLKKLRAARMALPVIMATSELPTWEFASSPWLRPNAVLLKPYSVAQLLGTVKTVLRTTAEACPPAILPVQPRPPAAVRLRL